MKRVFVLCALVGVAAYATGAWSAAPPSPIEQRLSKDVATLKVQVKALQAADKKQNTGINTAGTIGAAAFLTTVCSDEITADALQGTWQVIDQVSAALQAGKTYFGPQTPVTATLSGQDICAGGGITRSQVLPPTVAEYQALLAAFHTNSLKVLEAYVQHK
jgi:hypothetical protein